VLRCVNVWVVFCLCCVVFVFGFDLSRELVGGVDVETMKPEGKGRGAFIL
jgi:hypothetical protein